MPVVVMKHDVDPAEKLLKELGDLSGFEVLNDRVLLAVYERPEKTAGGIYTTPNYRKEDQFQGKAALIVKMGPCVNMGASAREETRGCLFQVGDWVAVNPSDGWSMNVGEVANKVLLRLVQESSIHMRIPSPDSVW